MVSTSNEFYSYFDGDIIINPVTKILWNTCIVFIHCLLWDVWYSNNHLLELQVINLSRWYMPMVLCKTAETPVLTYWSCCSIALSHRYNVFQGVCTRLLTTHLLPIECVHWTNQHDLFKARSTKTWQLQFPKGFPVRVCVLCLLFIIIFHDGIARMEANAWLKQNMAPCSC